MTEPLSTETLAFKVVCDCLRLEEQKVERLEAECDGYVQDIVALTSRLARVEAEAERSAQGYETANTSMHAAMVQAIRERDSIRIELAERNRAS